MKNTTLCACLSLNRAPFSESSAFDFTSRVHSIAVSQHIFLNCSRLTSQRAGCSAIVGMTCQDSNLGEGHPIKKEKKTSNKLFEKSMLRTQSHSHPLHPIFANKRNTKLSPPETTTLPFRPDARRCSIPERGGVGYG